MRSTLLGLFVGIVQQRMTNIWLLGILTNIQGLLRLCRPMSHTRVGREWVAVT